MTSTPERELTLVAVALEKHGAQRLAFLEAVCAADTSLRGRLDALLDTQEQTDTRSALESDVVCSTRELDLANVPDEAVGQTLGRYKLLEKLGEGGYGVVYAAEQTEPVRRRVAVKVIKLGMDTKAVVGRFEAERQALALMDHENIARVLDAGATETGRPYFVMELVRGIRITDYCEQNQLKARERLELFIQVCQAIQHAHQKGIIHRDLKPSNILVTMHDGRPMPKVIDFGIAKATEGRLTEATVYTHSHQFIGTPAYMSPEQAEMRGLDIDTRSDIYSLGVLLYELLVGSTPFDAKELMASGLDAMRQTIRETEPARPSTRLSQKLTTADAGFPSPSPDQGRSAKDSRASSRRLLQIRETLTLLRGDLDWIVMKCLEKDRTRRYATANGLAADLQRHLRNEPVLARPPSTTYQLQKAFRRNRLFFSAGALVFFALALGITLSLWQAFRATRAEVLARQRLRESETISQFLTEVFQSPNPARDGRTITVAEALGAAAQKLESDLVDQPARRARLQATLGETYYALGLHREAIPLQEQVYRYYEKAAGEEHPETLMALNKLANSYAIAGRREETLALREQLLKLRRQVLGPEHPDTLISMSNLAVSYDDVGRRTEALHLEEEVVALRRKKGGRPDADTLAAMGNLAFAYVDAGRPAEALKLREEVLALSRQELGPEHPDTLDALSGVAESYHQAGRATEALQLREEALALSRKKLGPEHPNTLIAMESLAESYLSIGKQAQAFQLREEALRVSQNVLGAEHPETLSAMTSLAISLRESGRGDEAITMGQSSLALSLRLLGPTHLGTLSAMTELATSYQVAGRTSEAIELAEESLRRGRQHLPAGNRLIEKSLDTLATGYELAGRRAEAEPLREELRKLKAGRAP